MLQSGFARASLSGGAADATDTPFAVSVFADRACVRDMIGCDAAAAGLAIKQCGELSSLLEGEARLLGEVVLIDCPDIDAAGHAALARLDMRAARSGAHLVISTTVDALDAIFACCDQSDPQLLVDPTRAERVLALGRALAALPGLRRRELTGDDRLAVLRLTEQVGRVAQRLERLGSRPATTGEGLIAGDKAFRFESPAVAYSGSSGNSDADDHLARSMRPTLPDPSLVRRIIRHRQLRARFFDGELFADPAWDILLDLTAARAEHSRVSVTSLCIASGVPPTTALRWIGQMREAGLLERVEDQTDRRRAFIALSERAAHAMARYFDEVGTEATQTV